MCIALRSGHCICWFLRSLCVCSLQHHSDLHLITGNPISLRLLSRYHYSCLSIITRISSSSLVSLYHHSRHYNITSTSISWLVSLHHREYLHIHHSYPHIAIRVKGQGSFRPRPALCHATIAQSPPLCHPQMPEPVASPCHGEPHNHAKNSRALHCHEEPALAAASCPAGKPATRSRARPLVPHPPRGL